jgi:hypothetical protein
LSTTECEISHTPTSIPSTDVPLNAPTTIILKKFTLCSQAEFAKIAASLHEKSKKSIYSNNAFTSKFKHYCTKNQKQRMSFTIFDLTPERLTGVRLKDERLAPKVEEVIEVKPQKMFVFQHPVIDLLVRLKPTKTSHQYLRAALATLTVLKI